MGSLSCAPILCDICCCWTPNSCIPPLLSFGKRNGFGITHPSLLSSASRGPAILRVQNSNSTSTTNSELSPAAEVPVGGDLEKTRQCRKCLKDLAETLVLPADFLSKLPDDLRLDLNDAAFALSTGPLNQECGEKAGKLVMGLSRAFEQADTQTTAILAREVPSLQDFLSSDPFSNSALGKRLKAAGNYLSSTGEYGNGELTKLSKAFIAAGEALSLLSPNVESQSPPTSTVPVLKFGSLQVEVTAKKAYTGAALAFIFGILCWKLTKGIEASVEDSSQLATENSNDVSTSLRGALLTTGYAASGTCAMATAGLLGLGSNLGPESLHYKYIETLKTRNFSASIDTSSNQSIPIFLTIKTLEVMVKHLQEMAIRAVQGLLYPNRGSKTKAEKCLAKMYVRVFTHL